MVADEKCVVIKSSAPRPRSPEEAGVRLSLADLDDPVRVGSGTTLVCTILNRGDQPTGSLKLVIRLPDHARLVGNPMPSRVRIAGMGELHLDIYVERIRREYKVDVEVGAPKVSYREAPTQPTDYDYKHKKQTGGSGQYAHIVGDLAPMPEEAEEIFEFENKVVGGRIPKEYIPSVEKGFRMSMEKGPIAGFPIVGVKATLADGSYHDVDSSDMAFQLCARTGFREAFLKTKPVLLEPIMKLEVEVPSDFQGAVTGELNKRRGLIVSTETVGNTSTIIAEVPLAQTFGYSTDLRSATQGQGVFSMEFFKYRPMPANVQKEVVEERRQAELAAAK